jgi:hypothetical protein
MVDMKIFERRNNIEEPNKQEDNRVPAKKSKPLPNIGSLFSEKDVSSFVKKLFQNNLDQYKDFIKKLELLSDWKVTFRTIEEEFQRRKINPRQNEAMIFADKLFKRYYPD